MELNVSKNTAKALIKSIDLIIGASMVKKSPCTLDVVATENRLDELGLSVSDLNKLIEFNNQYKSKI